MVPNTTIHVLYPLDNKGLTEYQRHFLQEVEQSADFAQWVGTQVTEKEANNTEPSPVTALFYTKQGKLVLHRVGMKRLLSTTTS